MGIKQCGRNLLHAKRTNVRSRTGGFGQGLRYTVRSEIRCIGVRESERMCWMPVGYQRDWRSGHDLAGHSAHAVFDSVFRCIAGLHVDAGSEQRIPNLAHPPDGAYPAFDYQPFRYGLRLVEKVGKETGTKETAR